MMENRRIRLAIGLGGVMLSLFLVAVLWPRESKPEMVHYKELPPDPLDQYEIVHLDKVGGKFPNELFKLRNLSLLIIDQGGFTSVPDSFSKLPRLRRVVIKNTPLNHIPGAFFNGKTELNQLVFENCPIETIDPRARKCWMLEIVNAKLNSIPPELFDSTSNLSYLNLAGNQIEEVPNEITGKYGLYRVDLSRNPIVEIPWGDTMWWGPINLNLSGTLLEKLPENPAWGGRILEYLDVRNTPLREVPQAWRELVSLKYLLE